MSRGRIMALAVLVLAVSLVVLAPARLVSLVLPPNQIALQGFSGSVWRGSAARAQANTGAGYLHLGAVSWSLDPWSLLRLAPRMVLSSHWGGQKVDAEVVLHGERDLDVVELQASLPADLVRQLAPLAVGGVLSLQLESLRLRDGLPQEGSGRLVWQNARWQSPQAMLILGSYVLKFEQQRGQALTGEILTLSGPVQASGQLQLLGSNYSMDVLVSGDPLDGQIQQALSLLAAPQSDGYRVKFSGVLQGMN